MSFSGCDVCGTCTRSRTCAILIQLVFVFASSMPMIDAFFVVAPRRAIDPDEPAGTGTWALRYLWAIAAALVGERVIGPLAGGGG